jgi:hypothetical protein
MNKYDPTIKPALEASDSSFSQSRAIEAQCHVSVVARHLAFPLALAESCAHALVLEVLFRVGVWWPFCFLSSCNLLTLKRYALSGARGP